MVAQRTSEANGVRLHIAEQGTGPLVVLLHGFPESWHSWRRQFDPLAAAGFRVVAPDQRGYGRSDRPEAVDAYTILHLVGDVVALIQALGEEKAYVVGHDWGAPVAWHTALLRPEDGPEANSRLTNLLAELGYAVVFVRPGRNLPPTAIPEQVAANMQPAVKAAAQAGMAVGLYSIPDVSGVAMTPEMGQMMQGFADRAAGALAPYAAGRYSNFTEETGGAERFFGGETWDRLRAVKRDYDPGNLFRANHPIPPADAPLRAAA